MVLILFGCGSVAIKVLFGSNPPIPGEVVMGGYTNVVLGWGLAVTFGVYISGTISGGHLNPAVTIALAATTRFPWSKVLHYIVAQFAGAFIAALLLFVTYHAKGILVEAGKQAEAHDERALGQPLAAFAVGAAFVDRHLGAGNDAEDDNGLSAIGSRGAARRPPSGLKSRTR